LIGTGNGHGVLEVTPAKEIVWQVGQDDLAGIRLAWVTTVQVLGNGNILLGKLPRRGRDAAACGNRSGKEGRLEVGGF